VDAIGFSHPFLRGCTSLTRLPAQLDVKLLCLADCTGVTALPSGLACDTLNLHGTRVCTLPDDLSVIYLLDLSDCRELNHLPAGAESGIGRRTARYADRRISDPSQLHVS
jgi:hypothetical protein